MPMGVDVIVAALAAGASAGAAETAQAALREAYAGLREILLRRLADDTRAVQVLDEVDTAPDTWRAELSTDLTAAGIDHDEEVLAAARRLLAIADPAGSVIGEYSNNSSSMGADVSVEALNRVRQDIERIAAFTSVSEVTALRRAIATETFVRRLLAQGRRFLVEDDRGRLRYVEFPEG